MFVSWRAEGMPECLPERKCVYTFSTRLNCVFVTAIHELNACISEIRIRDPKGNYHQPHLISTAVGLHRFGCFDFR